MLKHSFPIMNSVIRNERQPKNSDTVLHFFTAIKSPEIATDFKPGWRRRYETTLDEIMCQECDGSLKVTMKLTGMKESPNTPYKYFTRTTMSFAELTAIYPERFFHKKDSDIRRTLGAFVLHKKTVLRNSYSSVSDFSVPKDKASEKIVCFIERIDNEGYNSQVHQHVNFIIESFKAHPISKYLQGFMIYKNIQSSHNAFHCPDTIIEFAVRPKTGKHFAKLLNLTSQNTNSAKMMYGVFKRKQIVGHFGV